MNAFIHSFIQLTVVPVLLLLYYNIIIHKVERIVCLDEDTLCNDIITMYGVSVAFRW